MAKAKEQVKLTEEELNELREIRQAFQNLRAELAAIGQLRLDLNEREAVAANFSRELRAKDQALGTTLQEKYGDSEIDLETGEVTPKSK